MGKEKPTLIGVTLLTSLSKVDMDEHLWVKDISSLDYVVHLAKQAQLSGLDGVVCSAHEASEIRNACGADFLLVTPGIRPKGTDVGDQSRIMTPGEAIQAGSDYLVVGRPITGAPDPFVAAKAILDEMGEAFAQFE